MKIQRDPTPPAPPPPTPSKTATFFNKLKQNEYGYSKSLPDALLRPQLPTPPLIQANMPPVFPSVITLPLCYHVYYISSDLNT